MGPYCHLAVKNTLTQRTLNRVPCMQGIKSKKLDSKFSSPKPPLTIQVNPAAQKT